MTEDGSYVRTSSPVDAYLSIAGVTLLSVVAVVVVWSFLSHAYISIF